MSIWSEISGFLSSVVTDTFPALIESIRTFFEGNPDTRNRVSFSVALIALSAKMAKADGVVTEDEIKAFHDVFKIPEGEFDNVSRLYNLAKRDVAGFDVYGAQVRALFPGDNPEDAGVLHDVIDALFHIAKADGFIHENELLFLEEIAVLFGFDAIAFERMKLRHTEAAEANPYVILGADPTWNYARLKAHYHKRVMESHPDKMIARGVPQEFVTVANDRLAAINAAWEAVESRHKSGFRQIESVT